MRLYYPNLIDSYSAISGTSQASTDLGYANVAQEHPSKVWRTGASSAAEYVTIDLGSSQSVTAAIIYAHNLTGSDSDIEIHKSSDNFAANDVMVESFTHSSGPMAVTFAATSARYWRIQFLKSAAAQTRDIGRIFIGNYVTLTGLPDWDGFEVEPRDLSQSERSEGGQIYSTQRDQYRVLRLNFSGATQAQAASLKTFCETVGTHKAFFMIADESGPSDESGETVYCKLNDIPRRKAGGLDSSSNIAWEGTLTANEML
jgi:hypothetical protein